MAEPMRAKIRNFEGADIHKILAIEEQALPKTAYSKETLLVYAERFPDTFLVLEDFGDIIGYIIFDADGHVYSMAVGAKHRRKGFGSVLLMHARKKTQKRLWLEVRSKNLPAIRFYKKMDMKVIGKATDYYGDDDALIMVSEKEEK